MILSSRDIYLVVWTASHTEAPSDLDYLYESACRQVGVEPLSPQQRTQVAADIAETQTRAGT